MQDLNGTFEKMIGEATSSAELWGARVDKKPQIVKYVDLRYRGQSTELSIPSPDWKLGIDQLVALTEAFEAEHEKTYGHRLPGYGLEVVNLRVQATIPARRPSLKEFHGEAHSVPVNGMARKVRKAYFGKSHGLQDTQVLNLGQIGQKPRKGPLLVDCYDTTIVVPPRCTIAMGGWGNVVIDIN